MTKTWLKIISILEIVGGIFGIVNLIWWFLVSPFNIYSLIIASIPIAVCIFSILAGYWLWTGNRFGRTASMIVQAIQLPKIFSSLVIFMFSFGFDVWVQFIIFKNGLSNLGVEFKFLAFNQFFINVENAPTGLGLSITGLIFLIMLINYRPEVFVEEVESPPQPSFSAQNHNE